MIDIAKRVYDHTWKIDPIVRSLLDTDFYKLLMAQCVHHHHRDVEVEFSIINRADHVPLARLIEETGTARATRPYPLAPPFARREHMAARQHLLWRASDVPEGIHRAGSRRWRCPNTISNGAATSTS